MFFIFFFFNDTATTEIYTLSLHDALPISADAGAAAGAGPPRDLREHPVAAGHPGGARRPGRRGRAARSRHRRSLAPDRKSTRLNSSHANISYAVFCLKKKKKTKSTTTS